MPLSEKQARILAKLAEAGLEGVSATSSAYRNLDRASLGRLVKGGLVLRVTRTSGNPGPWYVLAPKGSEILEKRKLKLDLKRKQSEEAGSKGSGERDWRDAARDAEEEEERMKAREPERCPSCGKFTFMMSNRRTNREGKVIVEYLSCLECGHIEERRKGGAV